MTLAALRHNAPVSARNERLALDALVAAIAAARTGVTDDAGAHATLDAAEEAVLNLHRPPAGAAGAECDASAAAAPLPLPQGAGGGDAAELAAALAAAEPALAAAAAAAAAELGPKLASMGLSPAAVRDALADVAARMRLAKLQEAASAIGSREAGEPPAAHACASAAAAVTAAAAAALFSRNCGFAVIDNALDAAAAEALRAELAAAAAEGALRPVAVQAAVGTRQDVVRYAAAGDPGVGPATAAAIALLKGVAAALTDATDATSAADAATSAALPPLAVPRHCMLACYPGGGAGYAAHRDNAADVRSASRNRRAVTAILYANAADWEAARDGGALRCHVGAAAHDEDGCGAGCTGGIDWDDDMAGGAACASACACCHIDIAPRAGRLVLFRSDALLHEVLPAKRHRFAVSIWILDAAPLPQQQQRAAQAEAVAVAPVAAAGSMDALD
jgi:hypothetical protein